MTHQAFYISDLHLGHEKTWSTFKKADGSPLRPFKSTEEMDETIIDNWNKTVRSFDKVYLLGDVVIARRNIPLLGRLNGKKVLVPGNHDIFNIKDYVDYFVDIKAVYVDTKRGWICSHIPLHFDSLGRWGRNVHGHLHSNRVTVETQVCSGNPGEGAMEIDTIDVIDPRYFNVSVEQINFTPISADELNARFADQGWAKPVAREAGVS